jgi:hypothetical protein
MLISSVSLWGAKRATLLRKLYYALLSLTALGCCLALGGLGMLTGLF